jgi:GDPmannose 4,6-dehydratase
MRPTEIARSRLDPSKAAVELGWRARYSMKEVVTMMLEAELEYIAEFDGRTRAAFV